MAKGVYKQSVGIVGLPNALRKLQNIECAYGRKGEAVLPTLVKIAGIIRDRAKANAPYDAGVKQKKISKRTGRPYGHLKDAIVAWPFSKQKPDKPAAFVAVNSAVAPHAHLVEFGTMERITKGGAKRGKMWSNKPAQPFFRDAVDKNKARFFHEITVSARKLIAKAAAR